MAIDGQTKPVELRLVRAEEQSPLTTGPEAASEVEGLNVSGPRAFADPLAAAREAWGSANFQAEAVPSSEIGEAVLQTFVLGEMSTAAAAFIMTSPAARNDMLPRSVWAMPAFDSIRSAASTQIISGIDAANDTRTEALKLPPSVRGATSLAA